MLRFLAIVMLLAPGTAFADLASIQAEPNLEKRSELAAENALQAVEKARKGYVDGRDADFKNSLSEVRESVDLCHKSLIDTGKAARRSPKYFKRAEAKLRSVIKRLEAVAQEVGIEDRQAVEDVKKHVSDVHDQILNAIMTQKR